MHTTVQMIIVVLTI